MGEFTIETDRHIGVGPQIDVYDHGPVTVIGQHDGPDDCPLWICLDCGYTAADVRLFPHADCEPEKNPLSPWRSKIESDGFPE